MLYFKEYKMREEFDLTDRSLQKIVNAISVITDVLFEAKTTLTSVFRDEPDSVHYYYRAVDIRSYHLTPGQCKKLVTVVNKIFPYGKGRFETMLYHDAGSGWHFHVQVKADCDA